MASEPLRFPTGRPPGGGGGSDGVEVRLGKLEVDVEYIRRDLQDLKAGQRTAGEAAAHHLQQTNRIERDLAVLAERVSHLPTKGFIFTVVIGIVSASTAIMLFADRIKAVFHIQS